MQPSTVPIPAPKKSRKILWIIIPAVVLVVGGTIALGASFLLKLADKNAGVDIVAAEAKVKAVSPNITKALVAVDPDGLGRDLTIYVTFESDEVTPTELRSIARIAAEYSSDVNSVKIVVKSEDGKDIDLKTPASDLGVRHSFFSDQTIHFFPKDLQEAFVK